MLLTVAESQRALAEMTAIWDRVQSRDLWPAAIAQMRAIQQNLVAAREWTVGPSTLMEVLAVSSSEVLHCRMLRWLLDPLARHGIGAMMLADLFEECELELADVAGVEVTVEETRERTRADVVVAPPAGGGVVIEAKVHAPEGVRQGERLEMLWPDAQRLVFLTLSGGRIPTAAIDLDRWLPLSWRWVADRARQHLDATKPGRAGPVDVRREEARHAVYGWIATVTRRFG